MDIDRLTARADHNLIILQISPGITIADITRRLLVDHQGLRLRLLFRWLRQVLDHALMKTFCYLLAVEGAAIDSRLHPVGDALIMHDMAGRAVHHALV